jgi:hypothetical protein
MNVSNNCNVMYYVLDLLLGLTFKWCTHSTLKIQITIKLGRKLDILWELWSGRVDLYTTTTITVYEHRTKQNPNSV